jgi:peptidoglycan/xylan/chitin deacetylase (PgdA/CDA1 family)
MTRRAMLALGAAAAGGVLAGCGRAARRGDTHTAALSTSRAAASPASTPIRAPSSPPLGSATRAAPVGPAVEFAHGPRTRAEVALTFHGAGDPGIARDLLAVFAAHRAAVTVLAVGSWLSTYPAFAHDIVTGGHELGNHTYNHLDIDSLDQQSAQQEIVRCRDLLQRLTGTGGAHFRPSQTQHASPLVLRLAGAAGYSVCLSYDIDSLDWTDPGADAIRRNVQAATAGSIVSMHFGHSGTVSAMPAILDDLAGRGLAPVTATTLLRP